MKRRDLIKSLAMTVLGASSIAVAGNALVAPTLEPYNPFPLMRVDESFRYDSGLKVTFLAVKNDTRCPINARCTSPGNAEIKMRVKIGAQPWKIITLHTNSKPRYVVLSALEPGTVGIPKSYILRVTELTPGRTAGKTIKQSDYRMRLSISVAY